jgi:hypothetical protein
MHELRMTNDIAPPIEIGVQGMKVRTYGSFIHFFYMQIYIYIYIYIYMCVCVCVLVSKYFDHI